MIKIYHFDQDIKCEISTTSTASKEVDELIKDFLQLALEELKIEMDLIKRYPLLIKPLCILHKEMNEMILLYMDYYQI